MKKLLLLLAIAFICSGAMAQPICPSPMISVSFKSDMNQNSKFVLKYRNFKTLGAIMISKKIKDVFLLSERFMILSGTLRLFDLNSGKNDFKTFYYEKN